MKVVITRLVRVRINRRDNNPAMQPAGVAGIVTRLVRVGINRRSNRSRRRDLRGPKRGVERDKGTRASAIALRGRAISPAAIRLIGLKRRMSAFGTKRTFGD